MKKLFFYSFIVLALFLLPLLAFAGATGGFPPWQYTGSVTNGQVWTYNSGTGFWTNSSAGTGTLTSIAPTNGTLTFSVNPITTTGTIGLNLGNANTWLAKQTFTPTATVAGFNVGSHSGDPSSPVNGDLWYESGGNVLNARINGATVPLGVGSGTVIGVLGGTFNGVTVTFDGSTTTPAISAISLADIVPTTVNGLTFTAASVGFTVAGGTTSKTLTVAANINTGTSDGTLGAGAFQPQTVLTGTANQIAVTNGGVGATTLSLVSNTAIPGAPTTTTAALTDSSTKVATTAYVMPATSAISASAIDWSASRTFTKTLSSSTSYTITFSNATDGMTIVVRMTGASAATVTWPTVKWAAGTPPTQSTSNDDVYTFIDISGTIYGSAVQNMQ